ncbi:hypothetical protein CDG76_24875 [Nostoc sp. 'Peltigera membranacea cyanobiont' 210A]|uniref:hypothetical protein n=1 Tax=Nostoc sp. 'Peltigera membranacea cyanobiont' 210A TaxID=2014529 RepID=UPI000B951078|nr:hypothetical protein [Nostoc sp. 'Peltigera membranacea cyanobiont' 210A]OYD91885.1 hypothetical protein CDG76_24875 [Nostoc sp. 'Peltigera membranacea cyanobiont' 210A]
MKSVVSAAVILTLIGGGNSLPSYGLLSNIKPSNIEVQSIAQGHHQQLMARVGTTFNTPFYLKYGKTAYLPTENIEIKFSKVIQDSRCPSDVTCIWQGQVIIGLDIIKNGKQVSTLMLTLVPGRDALPIQFLDKYSVTLIGVSPYPNSKKTIVLKDYIAKIVVSKP